MRRRRGGPGPETVHHLARRACTRGKPPQPHRDAEDGVRFGELPQRGHDDDRPSWHELRRHQRRLLGRGQAFAVPALHRKATKSAGPTVDPFKVTPTCHIRLYSFDDRSEGAVLSFLFHTITC